MKTQQQRQFPPHSRQPHLPRHFRRTRTLIHHRRPLNLRLSCRQPFRFGAQRLRLRLRQPQYHPRHPARRSVWTWLLYLRLKARLLVCYRLLPQRRRRRRPAHRNLSHLRLQYIPEKLHQPPQHPPPYLAHLLVQGTQ